MIFIQIGREKKAALFMCKLLQGNTDPHHETRNDSKSLILSVNLI